MTAACLGQDGMCLDEQSGSSLMHTTALLTICHVSLAKKVQFLLIGVGHVKSFFELDCKLWKNRMCLNSIMDNGGVRSKRTHGYSLKTPRRCTPVTGLPGFQLQHTAQGRYVHSTSHNTALPWLATPHRQSENKTPQHSKEYAGRGGHFVI